MKTKIVYVLVSSPTDIYLEQLWVSLYSLRQYHPSDYVMLVADSDTVRRLESRESIRGALNEVKAVDFTAEVSNKERSRWLKTNLRSLVSGDFLFLDTDTVVVDDLSGIDDTVGDVAMVLDLHCHFKEHPFHDDISHTISRLFGVELKHDTEYYNSGVIYAKDTQRARDFFGKWHDRWNMAKDKKDGVQDQQSLAVVVNELSCVMPFSGEYNCQVLGSVEFLNRAKIVHFFNTKWSSRLMSPFFDRNFYEEVKHAGTLSSRKKYQILHCRDYFVSPSMMIGLEDMRLWLTPSFNLMRNLHQNHKHIFEMMNLFSKIYMRISSLRGG